MNMNTLRPSIGHWLILTAAALALTGCASFAPDGGLASVEKITKTRINKDLKWARNDADRDVIATRVAELLQKPLTIEDAVEIALLNNRGLQASFFELGIAEADWVQAGRLPI